MSSTKSKEQHEKEVITKFRTWTYSLTPDQYMEWWTANVGGDEESALVWPLPTTKEQKEGYEKWLNDNKPLEAVHRQTDKIMWQDTGLGGGKRRKSKRKKSKKRKSHKRTKKRKSKNRRKKRTRKSRKR